MFTLLWRDEEIGGRLYLQAMFLDFVPILGERGQEAMGQRLYAVMHKLTAMKYHLSAYRHIEGQLGAKYGEAFQRDPNQNAESFDLICHFEAFMFQLKSSLDMLVKLLEYVPATERRIDTGTYAKAGKSLVNALRSLAGGRRQKDAADRVADKLDALAALAELARGEWLAEAVRLRGLLIHDRGARDFTFTPRPGPDGCVVAQSPLYRGESVVGRMEGLYAKALQFAQDFMAHVLAIAAPQFNLAVANPQLLASFSSQHTEYIKWGWELNGEVVTGVFHMPGPER